MPSASSRVLLMLISAVTTVACTLVGVPAQASTTVRAVATGLDNPRGLAFSPQGALYITEAGRGGEGPCVTGPEGDEVCWGATGAITKIWKGKQSRVLTGLPSIAAPDGSSAIGPSDVAFRGARGSSRKGHSPKDGNKDESGTAERGKRAKGMAPKRSYHFTVGLGADPAARAELPAAGQQGNGLLLRSRIGKSSWSQVADIAAHEAKRDPDGGGPDSNPNSVVAAWGGHVAVDAGGNSLLWVSPKGTIVTLAVFDERMVPAPASLGRPKGAQIPMQAVPTSVVRGPDGAFYVGQLTGFPFPKGAARVYRVVPGQDPEVYARGFTNIIDIGFASDGALHVLEISHNGLLSGDPTGALLRVGEKGARSVVLRDELTSPGGLAIRGDTAYVSNCGTCPGDGSVLRVPLG